MNLSIKSICLLYDHIKKAGNAMRDYYELILSQFLVIYTLIKSPKAILLNSSPA